MLEQKRHKGNNLRLLSLALTVGVAVALSSCSNRNTVNIMITNRSSADVRDREIRVSVDELHNRLHTTPADTLIVMNEKNKSVDWHCSADGRWIVFRVPVVKGNSQKGYSINRGGSRLADNLFRFRRENIVVEIR